MTAVSDRTIPRDACPHHGEIRVTETMAAKCADCAATDHLRLCTSCGQAFCCESDRAHNRAHFEKTGHPIIRAVSALPHSFTWCWVCRAYLAASPSKPRST